jgi:hypothetical protein
MLENNKKYTICAQVNHELHKYVKLTAVEEDTTMHQLALDILMDWAERRKKRLEKSKNEASDKNGK